jgi:arylsulfatase A-like enzyme
VVLLVLDSVRSDHLSCYGHDRPTTPAIDRLAREGVRFTRASAATCWTLPSHASLFTGRYPSEHRADLDTGRLNDELPTLAEELGRRGYDTGCITCNGFVASRTGLDRGFDTSIDVHDLAGGGDGPVERVIRGAHRRLRRWTERDRGAARATKRARSWLSRRSDDTPFFLFLNYMDCHLPYALKGPPRYRFVPEGARKRMDRVPDDPFAVMAGETTASQRDLEDLQALYDGALRYLDGHVERIRTELEHLDRWEDTIFVVTSDHGEGFGEHGLLDHQYGLYQEHLSVPLVIRLPGGNGARSTIGEHFQLVDLFPLLLGLVDADGAGEHRTSADEDGADSYGARLETLLPDREAAFAEYLVPNLSAIRRRFPDANPDCFDVAMRTVVTDRWKLIWRDDGESELYDLVEDPGERMNRSHTRPDVVRELMGRIRDRLGGWPEIAAGPALAGEGMEAVRDRLQALGYL